MNRVQKKCLFASTALHGLLAAIIIVGPAFLPRKPRPPDLPILTVIPDLIIDRALQGGGNPNGRLPSVQPPVQQSTPPALAPEPTPAPRPEPKAAPPESEPAPPAPKPVTPPKKEPAPAAEDEKPTVKEPGDKPAPSKPVIKVDQRLTRLKPGEGTSTPKSPAPGRSPAQGRAGSQTRNQAVAQLQAGVSDVVNRLAIGLSSGTSIERFGPGGGGEVYASWEDLVKSIYDAAWHSPAGGADETPTVRVRVKVARNGTVLADEIRKHSRIRALDESVQEALDQVRARGLPAFPDGAKENERTLIINFIYRKPGLG